MRNRPAYPAAGGGSGPRIAMAVNSSEDPRVLGTLGMEGVALVLWQRGLPAELCAALDALAGHRLPKVRHRLIPGQVKAAVLAACDRAGTGECAERLASEVAALAAHAQAALAAPLLDLRLGPVADGVTTGWQPGAFTGRFFCTLLGPGVEFGPSDRGGPPKHIRCMSRGEVGIFRGLLWPGPDLPAILHRVPRQAPGEPQLTLLIEPVDDGGRC